MGLDTPRSLKKNGGEKTGIFVDIESRNRMKNKPPNPYSLGTLKVSSVTKEEIHEKDLSTSKKDDDMSISSANPNEGFIWKLYHYHEIPVYFQFNKYIKTGYRKHLSFSWCLRSLFKVHNETGNVWTHLLSFVFFLGKRIHSFFLDLIGNRIGIGAREVDYKRLRDPFIAESKSSYSYYPKRVWILNNPNDFIFLSSLLLSTHKD